MTVIAIDGPAGAGKSTIARGLAERLNMAFLDTGAMYRALTLKAIREGVALEDEAALLELARRTNVSFDGPVSHIRILLDGEDVSEAIRTPEVTNNTFYIARAGSVREVLVEWQRKLGKERSLVGEGRDLGTVVFPNAEYKFYLDADFNLRVQRRLNEIKDKNPDVTFEQLAKDLEERDHKDRTRAVGPLKKADDAITIDSTGLSVDETVDVLMTYIKTGD